HGRAVDRSGGPQPEHVADTDKSGQDGHPDRREVRPGEDLVGAEQVAEPERYPELERAERPQVDEARVNGSPGPHPGRPPGEEGGPEAPPADRHRDDPGQPPRTARQRLRATPILHAPGGYCPLRSGDVESASSLRAFGLGTW